MLRILTSAANGGANAIKSQHPRAGCCPGLKEVAKQCEHAKKKIQEAIEKVRFFFQACKSTDSSGWNTVRNKLPTARPKTQDQQPLLLILNEGGRAHHIHEWREVPNHPHRFTNQQS